jgi:hypothetical protein
MHEALQSLSGRPLASPRSLGWVPGVNGFPGWPAGQVTRSAPEHGN